MLHSLAGLKTYKSRTKCSFVKTGVLRLTTHQIGSKRTKDKFRCWRILIPAKIPLYVTAEPLYNEVLGLTN